MFSAGVAVSVIMINAWFLSWISGLASWLTTGPLSFRAPSKAGRAPHA